MEWGGGDTVRKLSRKEAKKGLPRCEVHRASTTVSWLRIATLGPSPLPSHPPPCP